MLVSCRFSCYFSVTTVAGDALHNPSLGFSLTSAPVIISCLPLPQSYYFTYFPQMFQTHSNLRAFAQDFPSSWNAYILDVPGLAPLPHLLQDPAQVTYL